MNFEAMGSFRALLEQALRKYEGKPGDTKGAMLGGILRMARNLPTCPEHIERYVESLFESVPKLFSRPESGILTATNAG